MDKLIVISESYSVALSLAFELGLNSSMIKPITMISDLDFLPRSFEGGFVTIAQPSPKDSMDILNALKYHNLIKLDFVNGHSEVLESIASEYKRYRSNYYGRVINQGTIMGLTFSLRQMFNSCGLREDLYDFKVSSSVSENALYVTPTTEPMEVLFNLLRKYLIGYEYYGKEPTNNFSDSRIGIHYR